MQRTLWIPSIPTEAQELAGEVNPPPEYENRKVPNGQLVTLEFKHFTPAIQQPPPGQVWLLNHIRANVGLEVYGEGAKSINEPMPTSLQATFSMFQANTEVWNTQTSIMVQQLPTSKDFLLGNLNTFTDFVTPIAYLPGQELTFSLSLIAIPTTEEHTVRYIGTLGKTIVGLKNELGAEVHRLPGYSSIGYKNISIQQAQSQGVALI